MRKTIFRNDTVVHFATRTQASMNVYTALKIHPAEMLFQ